MEATTSFYSKYIPLLTPALKKGTCQIDPYLQIDRTLRIALSVFATSVVGVAVSAAILPEAIFLIPLVTIGGGIALNYLDQSWTDQVATTMAIDEWVNNALPSHAATKQITSSLKAAQLFMQQHKELLNKKDEEGYGLLDGLIHDNEFYRRKDEREFEIYKLFVDNDASLTAASHYGLTYFEKALRCKDSKYLKYMLKTEKVKSEMFESEQQSTFWNELTNLDSMQLLHQHSFEINAIGKDGLTPLLRSILYADRCHVRLSQSAIVGRLLELGADPGISCKVPVFKQGSKEPQIEVLNAFEVVDQLDIGYQKSVIKQQLEQIRSGK